MRKTAERGAAKAAALTKAQLATCSKPLPGPSQSGDAKRDTISKLSSSSGLSDDESCEEPTMGPTIVVDRKPTTSPVVIALKDSGGDIG